MHIFASRSREQKVDLVAQLVEQYTFNVWALGSSPNGITEYESHWNSVAFVFTLICCFFTLLIFKYKRFEYQKVYLQIPNATRM